MMCAAAPAVDVRYEAQRQALLLGEIGRMWRYAGDIAQALACCEQGEAVLRAAGVLAGPAWARLRYQVSSFYESEGRYEEARQASQEALALFEQPVLTNMTGSEKLSSSTLPTRIERTLMGDPVDLGRTYALLGTLDYRLGQFSEALAQLNIALAIYEQYDQKREIAHVSCNIGHLHLKRGEYEPAYAALRRSLSLAERIGDGPLTSVIFMNLGELEVCAGDLSKAEEWYRKSLALAERFHDQQYLSLWNTELASILIRQGKLTEAATSIREALRIGRAMQNAPCIGAALVTLGRLRLAQATSAPHSDLRARLLLHARNDVQRALELERLEAETRTKGQQVLAQVALLLGDAG
jgi:tetratricopeptide (TPR) repeat protein